MSGEWITADGFEWRRVGRRVELRLLPTELRDPINWTLPGNASNDDQLLEPVFHYFADVLPDSEERAWDSIYCVYCSKMVHAFNNETMDAWLDTGVGAVCLDCFYAKYQNDDGDGSFDAMQRAKCPTVSHDANIQREALDTTPGVD